MNQEVSRPAGPESLETGILLGQNQAFGLIAGRCSAAQAAAIRRLRNEKLYRSVTANWSEFCASRLNMSKRNADQIIALFEEFGPSYFEVSQLTRISAETYRAIQSSIQDGALHHEGKAIALIEDNAQQVAATVAEMRRAKTAPPEPGIVERLDAVDRRAAAVVEEFRRIIQERDRRHDHILTSKLDSLRLQLDRMRKSL